MKGISLFEQRKYEQALSIFQQVESEDPNFVFVKFYQGHCFYKMKKYHQAKNIYLNLYRKSNCSLQQQSYLIRYFKTVQALKYRIVDILSEISQQFFLILDQEEERKRSELIFLHIFIITVNEGFQLQQTVKLALQLLKQFINCQIFLTKLSELYLKLQQYDLAKALCSQVLSLNPIYLPAVNLTVKIQAALNLDADQILQVALLMDPNILNDDYILELQLAELEEYEPKMFIPELHSIQENLFDQLNCFF